MALLMRCVNRVSTLRKWPAIIFVAATIGGSLLGVALKYQHFKNASASRS